MGLYWILLRSGSHTNEAHTWQTALPQAPEKSPKARTHPGRKGSWKRWREGQLGLQQVALWGLAGGQGMPRGGNRKYRGLEVGKDRSWSTTVWSGLARCGQGHRRAWGGTR